MATIMVLAASNLTTIGLPSEKKARSAYSTVAKAENYRRKRLQSVLSRAMITWLTSPAEPFDWPHSSSSSSMIPLSQPA
jgi:hypothetical protein